MPLNWKPELWGQEAEKDPDTFIQELRTQKAPSSTLFTKTYISCVREGLRGMQRNPKCHQTLSGGKYEEEYFTLLLKLLPHENAKQPDKYDISSVRHDRCDRAPVEFELWFDAFSQRLNPSKKKDPLYWIFSLRKPEYEQFEGAHAHFSLKNAPEWAVGYTEIQRGLSPGRLEKWLSTAPIGEGVNLVNTLANLQNARSKEHPSWLDECMEVLLARQSDLHKDASVHEKVSLMSHAMASPTPMKDNLLSALICAQPPGMSLLTHQWCGFKHEKDRHDRMQEWWSRQSPQERGAVLERWWSDSAVWDTLKSEIPETGKPFVALDMFTKEPVHLTSAQAKNIVQVSPLQAPIVRSFLSRIVPAIAAAELMVEPQNLQDYLLQTWDTMRQEAPSLSVDGLLEVEP